MVTPDVGSPAFDAARDALLAGRCVGIPTDTVYGLAARLADADAVASLFGLKGRASTKAMAVLVDTLETARTLAKFDDVAAALAAEFWPGPLTMVLRRVRGLDVDLGGDPTTIGVRCPALDVVRALAAEVGPLVTTSANRAGEPTLDSGAAIREVFGNALAYVMDAGTLADAASTVVDLTGPAPVVLRAGPVSEAELLDVAGRADR